MTRALAKHKRTKRRKGRGDSNRENAPRKDFAMSTVFILGAGFSKAALLRDQVIDLKREMAGYQSRDVAAAGERYGHARKR